MAPPTSTGANRTAVSTTKSGPKPTDQKSNERNEYIPSFIQKKPFYIDDATATDDDYLEHQRLQSQSNNTTLADTKWYDRGKLAAPKATKYRKGACENCGSMSHKVRDCLQRKRKAGARWTGKDIAGDELVEEVRLGWDAKRDRWNGFDAGEFKEVIEDYEALEQAKKRQAGEAEGEDGEGNADDGTKYEAETDMGRKQATSTRNLRLREDTAKYLLNLDLDSAKYDPKTRSMLDTETSTNELIAEDGFQKASGDAAEFEKATRYAWEGQERGDADKIHLQANPTEAQLIRKRKADDEIQKTDTRKKMLADKYGVQEPSTKSKALLGATVTSNERFVEYDERGKIKGEPERKEKSMYAEDVLVNNHTAVWGSWWKDFRWGYECCHSNVKNSFCTGDAGKAAADESERFSRGLIAYPTAEVEDETPAVQKDEAVPEAVTGKQNSDEARKRMDEMKAGVTEEQMEEYRKQRVNQSDPMAAMLGKDELL